MITKIYLYTLTVLLNQKIQHIFQKNKVKHSRILLKKNNK